MKKKVKLIKVVGAVNKLAPEMGGVFSSSDLANIIGGGSDLTNARMRHKLVDEGILFRVQKGTYVAKDCDLWILASRVSRDSYVSMDSVLARSGLIGTVPSRSLSAIHAGRKRIIETIAGTIYFHSLAKGLFFGIEKNSSGVRAADPEKAFIDLLYYYTKGVGFVIDPLHDVAINKLDVKKLSLYLKKYKNPKFITFVKGVLHEG